MRNRFIMQTPRKLLLATIIGTTFVMAGCGGDDEEEGNTAAASSILNIGAKAGAPIVGSVEVKDSLGAIKSKALDANGDCSIDVAGMTAPFMIKAVGRVGDTKVTYYSAATSADLGGNINVTPLTDLLVSNVAQQLAENYYKNPANFSGITADKLNEAESALRAKLEPILTQVGLAGSVNLLRTSFAANHSGLDAVLDLLKLEPDLDAPSVINIINKLTGSLLGTDDVSTNSDDRTEVAATGISSAKSDLDAIVGLMNGLTSAYASASGVPSKTTLAAIFDTSKYLSSGSDFDQDYADDWSHPTNWNGTTFRLLSATSVTGNPDRLKLQIGVDDMASRINPNDADWPCYAEKDGSGQWRLIGDQLKASVGLNARAEYWLEPGKNTIRNGLYLDFDPEPYNDRMSSDAERIDYAIFTGPGLPSSTGVKRTLSNSGLILDCDLADADPLACVDVDATVDNGLYTVKLYNAAGTILNGDGDEKRLREKPLASGTLTADQFPVITSVTANGSNVTSHTQLGGAVTVGVGWTLPAGYTSDWASVDRRTSSGTFFGSGEDGDVINPAERSRSIELTSVPSINLAIVAVKANDPVGRAFKTSRFLY